jgi:hypothetical protein
VGRGINQTYITAGHPLALNEKRILVLSADTQQQLDSMKALSADNTYFRINVKGRASLTLNALNFTQSEIAGIAWSSSKPSVASVKPDSTDRLKATVEGLGIGTTTVTASSRGCAPVMFTIVVLPEGEDTGPITLRYLTTLKSSLVIPAVNAIEKLSITGVNIDPADMARYTIWEASPQGVISLAANGVSCDVTALKAGKASIKITNQKSANSITIAVKVGVPYEWADNDPIYITTDTDLLTMVKGERRNIGASLANSTVMTGFSFSLAAPGKDGPIARLTGTTSGICLVEAEKTGVSYITIRNAAAQAVDKDVMLVVAERPEDLAGLKYLSTKQNIVTVDQGGRLTVSVTVKNSPVNILDGFSWTSSDSSIVSVSSSGQSAVLFGKGIGTAKITVSNTNVSPYPLEIIATCVNPVDAAKSPYITIPSIVDLTIGKGASSIKATLEGGSPADNGAFTWTVQDSSVCSLFASNDTAQIKALKQGVTQIVVSHPKANGIDRTILVICEPAAAADCERNYRFVNHHHRVNH